MLTTKSYTKTVNSQYKMENKYAVLKSTKAKELKLLNDKIKELIQNNKTELNEYFEAFLFTGAKRLRPLFIFLICDILDIKINDKIINLACAIELLHSASLIHDDIIDEGKIRRNAPCLHLQYNSKTAVLAGDYLLSLATGIITPETLKIISNATGIMTKSEINMLIKRFKKPTLEEYLEYSKEKTSTLFVAGVKSVFALCNIKEDDNIINFTRQFSLCFQVKDDINNYLKNDKNKLSKDMETGIYTLPFILEQNNFQHDIILECNEFLKKEILKTTACLQKFPNSKAKENLITISNLLTEE